MLDRYLFALYAVHFRIPLVHFITQTKANVLPGEISDIAAECDAGFEVFDVFLLVVAEYHPCAEQAVCIAAIQAETPMRNVVFLRYFFPYGRFYRLIHHLFPVLPPFGDRGFLGAGTLAEHTQNH
ncbi:hypothetical protein D3C87_1581050 [compost metagenome]